MKKPKPVKTPLDELTYKVNGLAMQVQSELKVGHPEDFYHRALHHKLLDSGLQVEFEKPVQVYFDDALVGYLFLDLWVEQMLVVECKARPHRMTADEIGQVLTYLVATGSPQGLLLNFGLPRLEFHRIFPPRSVQDWQRHLYRCVWTPRGHALPPLESMTPSTRIDFSLHASADSLPSDLQPPPEPAGAAGVQPIRLSDSHPLPNPSVSAPDSERRASPPEPAGTADQGSICLSDSHPMPNPSAYASSGVDIDAGERAVDLMREAVRSTYGANVLAGIGSFGGLFDASALQALRRPVLVASIDGVGTKVKVAAQAGRFDSIGQDIVNHCVNDILVQGARPLFFLDYLASSRLQPDTMAAVVGGMAAACRAAGCALLGGETAEMPGVYREGEFDVAGAIVGAVEREDVLPRAGIRAGDVLVGLRSTGAHTNGYSLIRSVFEGVPLDSVFPELGAPLADVLLAPHRSYLPLLSPLLGPASPVKALAHITGGGLTENIPRVLPEGLGACVDTHAWPVPPLFRLIQQRGEIAADEMYRVFNMGVGMVAVVGRETARAFQDAIGEETWVIGELVAAGRGVQLA